MQALGLSNGYIHRTCSPWKEFPQLKLLRVDWMRSVCAEALEPLRCVPSCNLLFKFHSTQDFRHVTAMLHQYRARTCCAYVINLPTSHASGG